MTGCPAPQIPGITAGHVTDLHALATALDRHLTRARPGTSSDTAFEASAWKILEEAGELAGAHARWRGTARRPGSLAEAEGETADLILAAAVYAVQAGVDPRDLSSALDCDLGIIGLLIGHADDAVIKVGTSTGHLLTAHEQLPASQATLPGQVARVIAAARIYAAHAGIDVHAAITAKARVILARDWEPAS